MRREFRKKQQSKQDNKILMYSIAGVLILLAIVFGLIMYSNSLEEDENQLSSEQIASIVENETDTESASSSIGRSIEEEESRQNEEKTNETTAQTSESNSQANKSNSTNKVEENKQNNVNSSKQTNTANSSVNKNSSSNKNSTSNKASNKSTTSSTNNTTTTKPEDNTSTNVVKEEAKKELNFQKPLEGEIMREFSKDNLIFSETLQEWVTHNGIDIKAEKATVVQAVEDGVIKSIKNDPRFGLTIVIEHENGFQTVYANLLSSEFVTEGENVTKGQSIGTVGNTAAFESADEPHLHFEVIKDSIQVDPNIYIKQ